MNTQKSRTSKKIRRVNNEASWNAIKELVGNRKRQKLQKKELFECKFSNISNILQTKVLSFKPVSDIKTIITKPPKNVAPGQIYDLYIDGKYMKIKCPDNIAEGNKIRFKTQNTRNIHKEIKDLIEIRRSYNIMYKMGTHYGYPKCCINDFVLRTHNEQKLDSIQELAGSYTGYVPCVNCSEKIVSNKLSIEKLIKDRKCNTKFPYDDEPGHIIPCKKHAKLVFLKKITIYQAIKSGCKDCYASDDESDEDRDGD